MKFREALQKIEIISQTLDADDPDKIEILDNEADFSELMEWALEKRNHYKAMSESVKTLADKYAKRKKSLDAASDGMRDVVMTLMDAAFETKYKGVAGTASIGRKSQGVVVVDESKLPDKFFETKRVLKKAELNKAVLSGEVVEGALLDNGGRQLNIR